MKMKVHLGVKCNYSYLKKKGKTDFPSLHLFLTTLEIFQSILSQITIKIPSNKQKQTILKFRHFSLMGGDIIWRGQYSYFKFKKKN